MRPPRPAFPAFAATAALAGALVLAAAAPPPHNLERALAAQRQLAAERPGDGAVFNDLGNLLALSGDTRAAEEAYRKSIELAPDDAGARFNYGLLLAEAGERFAAWRQFRATVRREPRHAWAWYQIGSLYEGWGLEKRARRAYARAFALDPRLADARFNPSVLDNAQTTPAMLEAWRGGGSATASAPRGYAEGGRIAGLLIDLPKKAPEAAAEPEQAAAPEGGGFARGSGRGATEGATAQRGSKAPGDDSGEPAGDEEELGQPGGDSTGAPRVLTGADLRAPQPLNQVSPGGNGGRESKGSMSRSRPVYPQRTNPYPAGRSSTGRLEPLLVPAAGASDPFAPQAG